MLRIPGGTHWHLFGSIWSIWICLIQGSASQRCWTLKCPALSFRMLNATLNFG